jgi:hypothetical protein
MTRTPLIICLAAAAALAGCNKESHTIVAGDDSDNDTNVAASGPVELPPAIAASKTYRCADNSVVYVDWLADNRSANVRTEANGNPTQVVTTEPGKPMTGAGGYSLTGSASSASVTFVSPAHGSKSCKA